MANMDPEQLFNLRFGCQAFIPGVTSTYGYVPSLAAGITFDVLFSFSLLVHLFNGIKHREITSYLLATGALVELMGWAARTWSSPCPYARDPFLMQTTTLIIGPTFITAAAYAVLGRLIILAGPKSSAFRPRIYIIVFVSCDLISLIVQAVGGALAAGATSKIDGDTKPGTNIMVAGIVFQMASMTIFVGVLIDFLIRCFGNLSGVLSKANYMVIGAMMLSMVAVYIRSIYRTIELLQGWVGFLITHEVYFIVFDAALMFIGLVVYQIPGIDLQSLIKPADPDEVGQEDGEKMLLSDKLRCAFARSTSKKCEKVTEIELESPA